MSGHDARPRPVDSLPASVVWRALVPLLAVAAIIVLVSIMWMTFADVGFPAALRRFGPLLLVGIGASLMATGARRRVGTTEHCAACDYEKKPGADAPDTCPECGAEWLTRGGIVIGRLKRNRVLFWAGLAVAALYLAGPLSALLLGRSLHLEATPTARLIEQVVAAAPGGASAAWDVLRDRPMTTEQQIDLARGLLDKRLERRFLSRDAEAWLETVMTSARMPEALVERYYTER
ncbi:MAG: hypothetical protein ACYSU7_01585 [Planctomycetota bacterium]